MSGTVGAFADDLERHAVSGVKLWAWAQVDGRGFKMAPVVTDAAGAFRLQNVPDGLVIFQALSGPLDQPCAAAVSTIGHDAEVSMDLVPPTLDLPSLTVAPTNVRGRVFETTAQGRRAIAGARVSLEWTMDLPVAFTTTDSAGRYNLCGLPFGFVASVLAQKSAYDLTYKTVSIGADLTVDLELIRSDTSSVEPIDNLRSISPLARELRH